MQLKDAIRYFCLNETQAKEYFQLNKPHRFASLDEFYNHQAELIMKYFKAHGLQEDLIIPEVFVDFMNTLKEGLALTTQIIASINSYLKNLTDNYLHDGLLGLVNKIILAIYDRYKKTFKDIQNDIVQQTGSGQEPHFHVQDKFVEYLPLINIYLLIFKFNLKLRKAHRLGFPETPLEFLQGRDDIPLAINGLILTKKIDTNVEYFGIDFLRTFSLSRPFLRQQSFSIKRGIKDIGNYSIFQRVQKFHKGATRNEVYVASNARKIIFLRDSSRPHQNEIFASKLAAFVSKKHFSSERLFSNGLTGSRKLNAYKTSVINDEVLLKIIELIDSTPRFFPGTGLIDEVLNFVKEKDPNLENYGISSLDIEECFFSKIDFDLCDVVNSSEEYEVNRCTSDIYSSSNNGHVIHGDIQYISEKFYARIKLCILTPEFYLALNSKVNFNPEEIKKVIVELTRRREVALKLMFLHPKFNEFLTKNNNILNTIYQDTTAYVKSHFDAETSSVVLESITRSVENMEQLIKDRTGIALEVDKIVNSEKLIH